jgi:tetratricopeptide (TPR) repeat protein
MNAQEYLSRGNELFNQNNFDGAISEFLKALEIDPDFTAAKDNISVVYFNRGLASYQNGDKNKAITDITEALKYKPDDVSMYGARGTINGEMGNYDAEINDFTEVIRLEPTAQVYCFRALSNYQKSKVYLHAGDHENYLQYSDLAINDAKKAVELEPNNDDFKKSVERMESEQESRKKLFDYSKTVANEFGG